MSESDALAVLSEMGYDPASLMCCIVGVGFDAEMRPLSDHRGGSKCVYTKGADASTGFAVEWRNTEDGESVLWRWAPFEFDPALEAIADPVERKLRRHDQVNRALGYE